MLDTRRLPIPGIDGYLVDARCRIFRDGSYEPIEADWPYVTIPHHDLVLSFKVCEAAALAFLGEEGCSDIYRELFVWKVEKGHPRTKQIALEKGLSEWIILEAARAHYSQFKLTLLLMRLRKGPIDETMRLHRVEKARIGSYKVYPVEEPSGTAGPPSSRRERLHDHVIGIGDKRFRLRQKGGLPLAMVGDEVSFAFRLDPQGGVFIVRSTFRKEGEPPPAEIEIVIED